MLPPMTVPAEPSLPPASPVQRPLRAFAWMLGAIASFVLMAVAGREIQAEMNTFELMLYRSVIGFGIVALVAAVSGGPRRLGTSRPGLHLMRNVFHFAGQNMWFLAVALVPLAQLAALEFTNPIWVALLAPLLLGERLTAARLVAVGLGFVGVLIVARPGVAPFEIGHAAGLGAAFFFALTTIWTRRIMAFDDALCVVFWMAAAQTLMALPLALPGGVPWPTAGLWPWIGVVSVTGLSAHYALTSALGHAPAGVVAPMEYLRLPVVAAVGALVYAETVEAAVILGAAFIIAGNLIGLRAETRKR